MDQNTRSQRALADIIRSEFMEMPGLRLTESQAARLWNADEEHCAAILRSLVDEGFLRRTEGGMYMRACQMEGPMTVP